MLSKTHRRLRSTLLAVVAFGIAACADQGPVAPAHSPTAADVRRDDSSAPLLPMVEWNTARTTASSRTQYIGLLGGIVSSGGVTLIVPPLAVTQRTAITLTVPAGKYVMAELEPHGLTFKLPPTLLFPLTGTSAGLIGLTNLIGVYTTSDPVDGWIQANELYPMNLLGISIGFQIHHFSSYAPADNRKGYILMGG